MAILATLPNVGHLVVFHHCPDVQTRFDIEVRQDDDLLSLLGEYAKRAARRFFRASFRAATRDENRGNI